MRGKRLLSLLVAAILAASCLAVTGCVGGKTRGDAKPEEAAKTEAKASGTKDKKLTVAIVTAGTFGSQAFTDVALAGCQKAEEELGIKLNKIENCQMANAADTLRSMSQGDIDVFILTSGAYADTIRQLSKEFPEKVFVSADMALEPIPNVISVGYREQEASFLAGALAAMMTKDNKVAFVGGQPGGSMDRFEMGYSCGARYANPEVEASTAYVGNFNDVNKAKELAAMLYDQGNDWLVPAAGASNLGVFQAASEKGANDYTLGAADGQFQLMPNKIVASQVKRIDHVCYMIIDDLLCDRANLGKTLDLGLKEDGVGLIYNPDEKISGIVPQEKKDKLKELAQDIMDGRIVVPKTVEELAAFPFPKS